jgi:hypothetical protein
MTDLLNSVLQAHGGIERWRSFDTVRATFVSGGGLLPLKGLDVTPQSTEGVATIQLASSCMSRSPSLAGHFLAQAMASASLGTSRIGRSPRKVNVSLVFTG